MNVKDALMNTHVNMLINLHYVYIEKINGKNFI